MVVMHRQYGRIFAIAAALLSISCYAPTLAQSYPERPLRVIVPFSPGGTADVLARLITDEFYKTWNKPAVVVNKDGGDTILGVDMAAKSSADGHTLLVGPTAMAINTALGRPLPYDIKRDLAPVSLSLVQPLVLVAAPFGPVATIADLIKTARADPARLRYGSLGTGGIPNMSMELLKFSASIDLVEVPYKGSPAAIIDVMNGQIELLFSGITSVTQHIKSGRLKGVAITGSRRSPLLPDVPTIAEYGFPKYEVTGWYGVFARRGTTRDVVNQLNTELRRISALPEARQKIAALGGELVSSTPDEFARFVDAELRKWTDVVKVRHIQVQ
jgi:tripartite-type tricarboxylate transporter receptor subunit TctC